MSTPTSPSVAFAAGVPHIVFTGTDGLLYDLTGQSKLVKVAGGISAKAGTTPAVAAQGNAVEVAFTGTDGDLYLFNELTGILTHIDLAPVRPGTNPAITADGTGGFVVAVVNSGGLRALQVVNADHTVTTVRDLSVADATSPAIASDGRGGWRVAVTDSNNHLASYDSDGVIVHTAAVVASGTSPAIAYVLPAPTPTNTTTGPAPSTATLALQGQFGGSVTFIPYVGAFPSFGSFPPFHLIQVQFPQTGFVDQELFLVKPGHNSEECGDPNAVIPLPEGQSLTPSQITTLYGSSQPHFTTLNPLTAVACWNGSGPIPGFVDLSITIQND